MNTEAHTEVTPQRFHGRDGAELAYRELGAGRPLVLVHGYLLPAARLWLDTGIAAQIAAAGHRVIMPDLRGHGDSTLAPDPAAYPPDALTDDLLALLDHLDLADYDLGGYSLGGRVVVRALARGAAPRRAIAGGTGLDPIVHAEGRGDRYRRLFAGFGSFEPGSLQAALEERLIGGGADIAALALVLDTFVDTAREDIAAIVTPTLVVAGVDDDPRGVHDLAAALPRARLVTVPGDHGRAVGSPQFRAEIVRFLAS